MAHKLAQGLLSIQVLRAVAALLVVVWHSHIAIKFFVNDYWLESAAAPKTPHYPFWINHLFAGVDIFFCISGFIMCMLAERCGRSDGGAFLYKRFLRIVPPYWLFTGAVVAVYLAAPKFNVGQLTGFWQADLLRFVQSMLLWPADSPPILGVGWTLVHEFIFYYVIAMLIVCGLGKRITHCLGALAAVAVILSLLRLSLLNGYFLSPYYLEFFAGALAFSCREQLPKQLPGLQVVGGIAAYLLTSDLLDAQTGSSLSPIVQCCGYGAMGYLLISGMIGLDEKYALRGLTVARVFARIGDASFSLYLSHWFVLSVMGKLGAHYANAPVPLVALWQAASVVIAVSVGIAFAERIELPFHATLLKLNAARRTAPASMCQPVSIGPKDQ
jgi:exopolysaccharide production protein ExoZ